MESVTGRETYGVWLSRKLDETGHTVRAFAKRMNPDNPEIARRTLRRYLSGQYVPRDAAKREIALHLGSDEIGPDDDDDEDDLLADLQRRVDEISVLLKSRQKPLMWDGVTERRS